MGNKLTEEETTGFCIPEFREDGESVIFKKLEKVGEPYEYFIQGMGIIMVQEYILANTNYIWEYNQDIVVMDCQNGKVAIEIKQNKEDIENKKDNYDGNMDKECIQICDALNSISDVHTTESCCGHCKDRFMVFFTCDNPHSLAIIARVFDRRYIGTSQPWYIELQTKDSGAYDYFIHSETKYDSEEVMMKDINQIIENIKYWCDDKFASHFKGCDDKPTLAPFDINSAKQGKSVRTRDGRKARIICFDRDWDMHIVALVADPIGETVHYYLLNGKVDFDKQNDADLMMLPEKKEGCLLVRKDRSLFKSREEAERNCTEDYVPVKVEFEI